VRKVNIKENLMVHLKKGDVRSIPLDDLEFMRRHACRYCPDYSAEFADLSFGGSAPRRAGPPSSPGRRWDGPRLPMLRGRETGGI